MLQLNQTRKWAVGFPRHLAPPENQGVVHHDDAFRSAILSVGNTGAPGQTPATVANHIAPDSSFFVFVNERHSGNLVLGFIGSIKTSAHGVAIELGAPDVIPHSLPTPAGTISFNVIGVHTTSQTSQIFNLNFGTGVNGRGVSLTAQMRPKIISGVIAAGPLAVSHISDASEFEFAATSIEVFTIRSN